MPMTPGPNDTSLILWALDLDGTGNPILAHRIVDRVLSVAHGFVGEEVRITACGQRLDQHNHPIGWWQLPPGEVPLAEVRLIHCGLLLDIDQATRLDNPPITGLALTAEELGIPEDAA